MLDLCFLWHSQCYSLRACFDRNNAYQSGHKQKKKKSRAVKKDPGSRMTGSAGDRATFQDTAWGVIGKAYRVTGRR